MAKALANIEAQVIKKVRSVTLELSHDEARTLISIFGHIGGSASTPGRRHAQAINTALVEELQESYNNPMNKGLNGSLIYRQDWDENPPF